MTSIITKDYLQIGGRIIPAEFMPDWNDGVRPPKSNGETNLFGAMGGIREGCTCIMGWGFCPENVLRWWFNEFWGLSQLTIPVQGLVIADPFGLATQLGGVPYLPERMINNPHGVFPWALVHRIDDSEGRRRYWDVLSKRRPFMEGGAIIRITQIGSIPPL